MVSQSAEANLVALARGLFGGSSGPEVALLLGHPWRAPSRISPEGLSALEDTLAKGAVLWLTRAGAWRDRLWTKATPPALEFPKHTVALLQWLLEQPLAEEVSSPLRLEVATGLGSELVLLAALASAVGTPAERNLASQAAVQASALCRIAFPVAIALASPAEPPPLTLDAAQDHALTALQPQLARWWKQTELLKARMLMPQDVIRAGGAQAKLLSQLFEWAAQHDRTESCAFLLEALGPLLTERTTAADFVALFDERLPLRERHAARQSAAAVLIGIEQLEKWDAQARTVRFIDDGYDAAQARVKEWESLFGSRRFAIARRVRDELAALPT